jgi:hypothetical protein
MTKKYHVYAYKHYWPAHLDDPNNGDIPVPYTKDEREYTIEASSESEALRLAEKEYGSGQRFNTATNEYIKNADGSWTIMNVDKVDIAQ